MEKKWLWVINRKTTLGRELGALNGKEIRIFFGSWCRVKATCKWLKWWKWNILGMWMTQMTPGRELRARNAMNDSQRPRNGLCSEKVLKRFDEPKDGGTPRCGLPLQISIRWKWLKGTLRVSNDASLRAHIDEELRSNGHRGEYNISRSSDGNCNGYARKRSFPYPHAPVWHQMCDRSKGQATWNHLSSNI